MLPKKLQKKIDQRATGNALRALPEEQSGIDFSSNDYLGFVSNIKLARSHAKKVNSLLRKHQLMPSGSTGSRLLTGNHSLFQEAETQIAAYHQAESALIFNSGYDANLGFFQSVPQRGDIILYDELVHASIRDGIRSSDAKGYKFSHLDITQLNQLLQKYIKECDGHIYVATESIFSMDGDNPDLFALVQVCKKYNAFLVIDEAHAVGVMGAKGQGLVQVYGLEHDVFARVITFGKALGVHGAAVLGNEALRTYLINFARSFIYTTGLPPHSVAGIIASYQLLKEELEKEHHLLQQLRYNINLFRSTAEDLGLYEYFIPSHAAIQCAIIPENDRVKMLSRKLNQNNFTVKPILSPTVSKGKERLRFCLHSFNTKAEILEVLDLLKKNL